MLTDTLKAFANKPFQENFDTTFMENMKNGKEKKLFLYNKKFQKRKFINQCFMTSVNFSLNKTTTLIPRSRTIMDFTST